MWRISRQNAIVVLTFHRVLPDAASDKAASLPGMLVWQSTFDALLQYISQRFEIVGLDQPEPLNISTDGKMRLCITFDDGWADNYAVAHPIATKHNVPMTIFVCPGKMGSKMPYWPEKVVELVRKAGSLPEFQRSEIYRRAGEIDPELLRKLRNGLKFHAESVIEILKSLAPAKRDDFIRQLDEILGVRQSESSSDSSNAIMCWADAAYLSEHKVAFGSHTQTHQILTALAPEDVRKEVSESRKEIEEKLAKRCRFFAYPNGNCSAEVREAVREADYDFAFTTRPGFWTKDSDPHLLPRINIWEGKLVGRNGKFSPVAFQYSVFWKAYMGGCK
jgi:peptidoglycan/xylan/chitin deacetylase (PgdA/CDA1 family)